MESSLRSSHFTSGDKTPLLPTSPQMTAIQGKKYEHSEKN